MSNLRSVFQTTVRHYVNNHRERTRVYTGIQRCSAQLGEVYMALVSLGREDQLIRQGMAYQACSNLNLAFQGEMYSSLTGMVGNHTS